MQIADLDDIRDFRVDENTIDMRRTTHEEQPSVAEPSLDAGVHDYTHTGKVNEREAAQVKHDHAQLNVQTAQRLLET